MTATDDYDALTNEQAKELIHQQAKGLKPLQMWELCYRLGQRHERAKHQDARPNCVQYHRVEYEAAGRYRCRDCGYTFVGVDTLDR